jgi:hypothetical protein
MTKALYFYRKELLCKVRGWTMSEYKPVQDVASQLVDKKVCKQLSRFNKEDTIVQQDTLTFQNEPTVVGSFLLKFLNELEEPIC